MSSEASIQAPIAEPWDYSMPDVGVIVGPTLHQRLLMDTETKETPNGSPEAIAIRDRIRAWIKRQEWLRAPEWDKGRHMVAWQSFTATTRLHLQSSLLPTKEAWAIVQKELPGVIGDGLPINWGEVTSIYLAPTQEMKDQSAADQEQYEEELAAEALIKEQQQQVKVAE